MWKMANQERSALSARGRPSAAALYAAADELRNGSSAAEETVVSLGAADGSGSFDIWSGAGTGLENAQAAAFRAAVAELAAKEPELDRARAAEERVEDVDAAVASRTPILKANLTL